MMRNFIMSIALLGCVSAVWAQAPRFSNDFLNIGVGARAHAMSGSVVSSVQDVTASFWNPAALTSIEVPFQVGAMHAQWFGGIGNYDFVSIGKKFGENGHSFGSLSVIRMAIDQIPNTFRLLDDDGGINYDAIEEFSVADYAFILSYGQRIRGSVWRLGGSVKVIHRNVGQFATSWGFGLDAGIHAIWDHWRFGVMARDVTSTFNAWTFDFTEEEKEVLTATNNSIPENSIESTLPSIHTSVGYQFVLGPKWTWLHELTAVLSTDGREGALLSGDSWVIDPRFGTEISYNRLFSVRAGVANFQETLDDVDGQSTVLNFEPTIGLGVRLGNLSLDYAYTDIGDQSIVESSHVISATLSFIRKERN